MAINKQNLKVPTSEEARKNGRKGGLASAKARKERKLLRTCLLEALEEKDKNGMTRMQYLVAKTLSNHSKGKLTFKDLKDLSDLLGETEVNVNMRDGSVAMLPKDVIESITKNKE